MSRFVSRHKFGVATAVAGVVLLVAGLGATYWAYLQAETARTIANERFDQVRSIANTLMFDVFDDVERVPGTNSARQTLAATAQTYLEALADVPGVDPEVQLEAAQGYSRLAHIFDRQAVADPANRELARGAQEKSRKMLETLTATHPNPASVYRTLARLHSDEGNRLLYNDNNPEQAREELTRSLESFGQAEAVLTVDSDLKAERFQAEMRMADSYRWENNLEKAIKLFGILIADIAHVRASEQEHPRLLKMHADAYVQRGQAQNYLDKHEPAAKDLETAINLYKQHVELEGESLKIDDALIIAYWVQGSTLTQLDQAAESLPSFDNALAMLEVQHVRDPNDRNVSRRIAIMKGTKAQAMAKLEQYDEAMAVLMEANEWFEAQAVADPDTAGTHRSVAVGYQVIGDLLRDAGRKAEACSWWQKTLDKWLEIDRRFGITEFDAQEPDKLRGQLQEC